MSLSISQRSQLQSNIALNLSLSSSFLSSYQSFFHSIAGFFIVEETVLQTTESFIPRSVVSFLVLVPLYNHLYLWLYRCGYAFDSSKVPTFTKVDEIWEGAVSKLKAVLKEQFSFCSAPAALAQIKDFVSVFVSLFLSMMHVSS